MLDALAHLLLSLTLAATPSAAPADDAPYRIGIEDLLHVAVWGERAIDLDLHVRADGKITVPLVNDVVVAGRTPDEVRQEIARRLAGWFRDPQVTVIVEQCNSFRVFVLGEVNHQGPLNFQRPTRLLQAISSAGGLTQYARRRITIVHEQGGVQTRTRIKYESLLADDSGRSNVLLAPGDTILVD